MPLHFRCPKPHGTTRALPLHVVGGQACVDHGRLSSIDIVFHRTVEAMHEIFFHWSLTLSGNPLKKIAGDFQPAAGVGFRGRTVCACAAAWWLRLLFALLRESTNPHLGQNRCALRDRLPMSARARSDTDTARSVSFVMRRDCAEPKTARTGTCHGRFLAAGQQ